MDGLWWQRHGRLWVFGPSGRLPRYYDGAFDNAGYYGYWWSSSPSGGNAWSRYLDIDPDISRSDNNPRSASRSGVLGMPIERSEGGLIL